MTDNTGEGMNIISYGINWREGDEVITTNHEHISALAPLYQIRDRFGITIRFADIGPVAERPVLKAIADLVTPRTRLIVLSHVAWTTGALLNVSEVGYMGREFGIPVLVDGAQSAGAIPIDIKALGVDFYAIPMQKWGGRQTAAVAGQAAVLKWLEETVGYEWLFARISALHGYAYNALKNVPGLTMLTPEPRVSGLISFTYEGHKAEDVVSHLRDIHNIHIRNIPSFNCLRVSTGFYNTEEEIDTLVQALEGMPQT